MATVYKIEITSHWIDYKLTDLHKLLEKSIRLQEGNEITVCKVERK